MSILQFFLDFYKEKNFFPNNSLEFYDFTVKKRIEVAAEAEVAAESEVAPEAEVTAETEVAPEAEVTAEAEVAPEAEVTTEAEVAPEAEVSAEAEVATEMPSVDEIAQVPFIDPETDSDSDFEPPKKRVNNGQMAKVFIPKEDRNFSQIPLIRCAIRG